MLESICNTANLKLAFREMKRGRTKRSPGIDGITVFNFEDNLGKNIHEIQRELMSGQYVPEPVRRVKIPKDPAGTFMDYFGILPAGRGLKEGRRPLSIPTIKDAIVQQAIRRIIEPLFTPFFSPYSYAYRNNMSAHQAADKLGEYIRAGHSFLLDADIEKFFDTVKHGTLIRFLEGKITDRRVISLILRILTAGISGNTRYGITCIKRENHLGIPQGGGLSPLLANLYLTKLDIQLVKDGLHFVRYADDVVIALKSRDAARRVKRRLGRFLKKELSLTLNEEKTQIRKPAEIEYLGFGFTSEYNRMIREEAYVRAREKMLVRFLKARTHYDLEKLYDQLEGWLKYYQTSEDPDGFKLKIQDQYNNLLIGVRECA